MHAYAVEALDVRMAFSGVRALRGCNLRVRRGEIHALLGENGAGKSTLVKILNGVHPRATFEGEIRIDGRAAAFDSPAQARSNGVGYVPQEIEVIEDLSVAENIFCGQMQFDSGGRRSNVFVQWSSIRQAARALLDDLGLSFDPAALVASLSAAQRQLVMIARALALQPSVLIMDEPTASLSSLDIERLFTILRSLKARHTTIIFVTHRLPEVFALCDRASILRDGVVAEELERQEFSVEALMTAMSGARAKVQPLRASGASTSKESLLLQADALTVTVNGRDRVRDVSLKLRHEEILGIAGLLGSGRTELLNALYGSIPHRGNVAVEGRSLPIRTTRDARAAGIALLTEDRKREGLLFNLPVRDNVTIGHLDLFAFSGLVKSQVERSAVLQKLKELSVKSASPQSSVAHLSGGNQQKLLFARVLLSRPKVLLLDEPTKGVDVVTRQEIYKLIAALAAEGMGIILVSSELEEVLELADRCLVMAEGRFIGEFQRGEADEESILRSIAAAQNVKMVTHG